MRFARISTPPDRMAHDPEGGSNTVRSRPTRFRVRQSSLNSGLTVHDVASHADKPSVRRIHARSSLTVVIIEALGHFNNYFANGRFILNMRPLYQPQIMQTEAVA